MPANSAPKPLRVKRFHLAPVVVAGGIVASALLTMSTTGTLAGFTAAITNSSNTAGNGSLVMQEQNSSATVTCTSTDSTTLSVNSATCSTINKFGGSNTMVPGSSVATTIAIKNTGTSAASSFTLTPGSCTQTNNQSSYGTATDLCSKEALTIVSGSTTIFSGTLASLASGGVIALTAPAAGVSTNFTFTVTMNSSAGNTYQALTASLPLTWTFNS